ncbi:MAG TPA: hypothetical protein VFX45_07195 [Solirubrobacterales bacterium]|nr:hypothetical protein [Solirubrobacterales bacterium]
MANAVVVNLTAIGTTVLFTAIALGPDSLLDEDCGLRRGCYETHGAAGFWAILSGVTAAVILRYTIKVARLGRFKKGLDPKVAEWPASPTKYEQRLASELVGKRLRSVQYEVDGEWGAAYLRLRGLAVAVATVPVVGRSRAKWPRRLALVLLVDPPPPLRTEIDRPGRIKAVELYEQDGLEVVLALRCSKKVVWLRCAVGDQVQAVEGEQPPEIQAVSGRVIRAGRG